METRKCKMCGRELPVEEFNKKGKGNRHCCKKCHSLEKMIRQANPKLDEKDFLQRFMAISSSHGWTGWTPADGEDAELVESKVVNAYEEIYEALLKKDRHIRKLQRKIMWMSRTNIVCNNTEDTMDEKRDRNDEVLRLTEMGYTTRRIEEMTGVSKSTVSRIVAKAKSNLDVPEEFDGNIKASIHVTSAYGIETFTPREMMEELARRGYYGTLKYTETIIHDIDITKL